MLSTSKLGHADWGTVPWFFSLSFTFSFTNFSLWWFSATRWSNSKVLLCMKCMDRSKKKEVLMDSLTQAKFKAQYDTPLICPKQVIAQQCFDVPSPLPLPYMDMAIPLCSFVSVDHSETIIKNAFGLTGSRHKANCQPVYCSHHGGFYQMVTQFL